MRHQLSAEHEVHYLLLPQERRFLIHFQSNGNYGLPFYSRALMIAKNAV